jgi:hypothetical protein
VNTSKETEQRSQSSQLGGNKQSDFDDVRWKQQ